MFIRTCFINGTFFSLEGVKLLNNVGQKEKKQRTMCSARNTFLRFVFKSRFLSHTTLINNLDFDYNICRGEKIRQVK